MMEELRKGLFASVNNASVTDMFRRNLQKTYVITLGDLINPEATTSAAASISFGRMPSVDVENTDVISEAKSQLKKVASILAASKAGVTDPATINHIEDLQDRIRAILDPK